MSLLQALNLPAKAGAVKPMPIMGITATQGAELTKDGARPIAIKAAATGDLRSKLDAKDKALRDAYAKLAAAQPKLDERIATARGDTKAAAVAQKADVDKHIASIERQLKALDVDRKALDDPRTDAKKMNDILARAKSQQPVGKAVEVDRHDGEFEKTALQKRSTTTTTSLVNGKSATRVSEASTSIGSGGLMKQNVESKETVGPTGRTSTTLAKTTTVGPGGYSTETTKNRESTSGDRTSAIEEKKGLKIGTDGLAASSERTTTAADGSGTRVKATSAVERGDGKAGLAATRSSAATDAEGNTSTRAGSAKGGLSAGKDGIGGYGEGQGSVERKSKGGLSTGAVAGLNANVVCNVTEIPGRLPAAYMLSTTINLGASIKGSVGAEKEGGGKVGVSVSGSANVYMSARHELSHEQAAAYVAAVKTGSGSQKEMAIIRTGLSQGWPEAQRMYLAMTGTLGSAADVESMSAGESKTVGRKTKGGVGVNADAKGFGIEAGVERSGEREMTVSKGEDGSAAYETKQGESDKRTLGGKMSVGVVEGGASIGKTVTTSTGYKFRVEPGMKNARELQDRIARLANAGQAEVDAFAKAHPETVVERNDVRDDSQQNKVTAGIGPVKGTFMSGAGVEDTVTRDAQGNVVDTRKRGHNEGGLSVTAGGRTIGSATEEQSAPRVGADGERVVDVTRKDTDTDTAKFLDSLPLVGAANKDKGALATVTGAEEEEDTSTRNVKGITLRGSDLKMLAAKARNENAWINACPSPRHLPAWLKAAKEIRDNGGTEKAVEDALARFVGSDNMRQRIVGDAVRGKAGDVSSGAAWEFPDSVASRRKDYEDLVLAATEKLVAKAAEADKAKADALAKNFLARLSSLSNVVRSASDFKQNDVKGEMMSAIASRQSKIEIEVRKLAGVDAATAEKGQERADYERLLDACITHQQEETQLFQKIETENKDRYSKAEAARNIVPMTVQIKNLQSTWKKDYDKMAMLAQENGWGKDHYHRFKPDTARLDHAVKTFTAGVASKPTAETKDLKRNPNAISDKRHAEINQDLNKSDWDRYNAIKAGVERAHTEAKRLVDELQGVLAKAPYPTVRQFFKQGETLFKGADANVRRCRPNYMDDMFDYGLAAHEQLKQALPLLKKAKGLVPKKA